MGKTSITKAEYGNWYSKVFYPKQSDEKSLLNGNINRMCVCDNLDEVEKHRKIAIERINRIAEMQKEKFNIQAKIKEVLE